MINFNRRKVIKLKKLDAAIVLTENGNVEASLPEIDTATVPENVLIGAAVVFALGNPELCKLMREHFLQNCAVPDDNKSATNDDNS